MAIYALYGVAALLVLAPIAVALATSLRASNIIYGACLVVTLLLGVIGLVCLSERTFSIATLPLGLPWLGAHFRIDALSAFFLVIVNLGGAAASLFALGYGRHEHAPERVLPFYPAYLAAMNLVVLADDAFSFLVSWEFMSLTSWALVVAHHRERENLRAGYVYLLMAGFGTLALLLAFGLLAGANGNYAFDAIRASHPSAALAALVLILALVGAGSKAGVVPLACLAAARSSGCAEPRLRPDERRNDQGRGIRLRAHHVRPARPARLVVEHAGARASAASPQ